MGRPGQCALSSVESTLSLDMQGASGGGSPSSDMHGDATETSRDTSLIGSEFLESTLRILKVLELSFVPEGP